MTATAQGLWHAPDRGLPSANRQSSCNSVSIDKKLTTAKYPTTTDTVQTAKLGPLSISSFSPVTITDLENRTNFSITVTNSGSQSEDVEIPDLASVLKARPSWILHISLSREDVLPASGAYRFTVAPSSSVDIKIYISRDAQPGQVSGKLEIPFRLVSSGASVTVPISVISISGIYGPDAPRAPQSAAVTGTVRDSSGKAIANALVTAFLSTGEWPRRTRTNKLGKFTLPLVSDDGLRQLSGPRQLLLKPQWNITVDADGYSLYSAPNVAFANGARRTCNVYLTKISTLSYKVSSTIDATNNGYGFWDMAFFGGTDRVITIPGIHPPGRNLPGNIVAFDLTGSVLWKIPVDEFCWTLSVSPRDDLAAVTCADGYLRVVSKDGSLILKKQISNHSNSAAGVAFSPDGTRLAVGTDDGLLVMETRTWSTMWRDPLDSVKLVWSSTAAELISESLDDGLVTSFTRDGVRRWRHGLGYSPLYLHVDSSGRTIAAGKSRVVIAWDSNGNQLWSREIAHTSNRTMQNRGATVNGDLAVIPSFNGLMYGLGPTGELLWQRLLPTVTEPDPSGGLSLRVPGPGHGATYVTSDGEYIAFGTRGMQVVLVSKNGSKLWESTAYSARPGYLDGAGYHPSLNSIVVTEDGKTIVAGFSDATIRIFRRQ